MKRFITNFVIISFLAFAFSLNSYSQTASWDYIVTGSSSSQTALTGPITVGGAADDAGYQFALPFSFIVYDDVYSATDVISMNSNGYIRFDGLIGAGTSYSNSPIPNSSNGFGQFLSYGGNTDGRTTSNVVYQVVGTSPNRQLIIQFGYSDNYNIYSAMADIEVVLYEGSNNIKLDFANVTTNATAQNIGINAGDGIFGTNLGAFPTQDTSFLFQPGSAIADPTSFSISSVSTNEVNLQWSKNAGNNDVIVTYNTTNSFTSPSLGNSYSVGNEIAPGMGTVLYQGSATSFTHSGLLDNNPYFYKIWSKTATNVYSAPGLSTDTITDLVTDPTNFSASTASSTSIDLSWNLNSSNNNIIIVANTLNSFVNPTDGSSYNVGNSIGTATVIYKGSATNYTHSSLLINKTYNYKTWSYDAALNYSAPGATSSASTASTPPVQNFAATAVGPTQIDLTWNQNASNDDVIITTNTISKNNFANPVDGNTYYVGNTIAGQGTIIYIGSLTNFSHTSLSNNTKYYYSIWSFDAGKNYSSSLIDSATTSSVQDPTSFSVSSVSTYQINLQWTDNSSNDDVIITYNTSSNFAAPQSGVSYTTGNAISGSGTIIYQGSANSFTHSGLLDNTQYYYKIWSKTASNVYSAPGLSTDTITDLVTDPTNFSASTASISSIDLSWNLNSNNNDIIVVANTSNSFTNPSDGSSYNVGNSIGTATVIYKGSATNYTHSSLSINTTYHYKIWSYDANLNYSSPGATSSASTSSTSPVQSFTATAISASQINLVWNQNTSSDDVIITFNTISKNNFVNPADNNTYYVGNTIAGPGTGEIIYIGSLSNFSHTSLSNNTKYYYSIWSFDAGKNYSSNLIDSATTLTVEDPASFNATEFSSSQIDLSWNQNSSSDDVMIAWNSVNNFATPLDGFPYIVGNKIGVGAGTVLYIGSLSNFSHINLNSGTKYYYKVWSINSANYYSSGLIDSATTLQPGISTFPYIEDFELANLHPSNPSGCITTWNLNTGWENVRNVSGESIDFIAFNGINNSSFQTGPDVDHTTGVSAGQYIFAEASGCSNSIAYLVSPLLNFAPLSNNPKLDFYYHMYGFSGGTLSVQISTDGGSTWSSDLWSKTGQQHTSGSDPWSLASIDLSTYAGMGNIKLRIKSINGGGYGSDYSVDDIKVYEPQNMSLDSLVVAQDVGGLVVQGGTNQEIIRVNAKMVGTFSAKTITQLSFNINGTTTNADISNAKVYFTGNNSEFSAVQQFGTTVSSVSNTFNVSGLQVLSEGNNYFWLTYDISSTATLGNEVDAELTAATIGGLSETPDIASVTGAKKIVGQITVGTGTSSTNNGPLYPSYYYGGHEAIYTSSEMGAQKEIHWVSYDKDSGTNTTDQITNVRIYMKNSNTSTFSSGAYSTSGYTKVYEGPFTNNKVSGWMGVQLDNAFLYDGTSNLHVLIEQDKPATSWNNPPYYKYSAIASKSRGDYDFSTPVTNLIVTNQRPNIQLKYMDPTPMVYTSSNTIQPNTSNVSVGESDAEVIGVLVKTTHTGNPLDAKSFTFTTNGTTATSDITSAKVYYSGTDPNFDNSTQFGTAVANPSGTFTVTGTQSLSSGDNYFWLAYDVSSTAVTDNYIDAQCTSVKVETTDYTPSTTSPTGERQIKEYITIGTGTASSFSQPVHYYYNSAWEGIYLQTEMGSSAKDINKLSFYKSSGADVVNSIQNVTIYMKHTTDNSLSSGNRNMTGYTQVFQGAIPNNAPSGWMEMTLDNTFSYNGSDNVQIMVLKTYSSYFTNYPYWAYTTTTNNRSRSDYQWGSTSPPPTYLTANNQLPNVRFEVSNPTNMTYVLSTAFHNNYTAATAGINDQEVLGIKVETQNSANPLNVTRLVLNTTGTTLPADVSNAKVYYTGTSASFAATNQFGSAVANPNGTITFTGNQTLASGINHFWLSYDLPLTATTGNYVDAQLDSVYVGSSGYAPNVSNPIGNRIILGALAGTYYIGSGGDYTTFTSAVSALNNYGVAGPVTFRVYSGTYTEQISLSDYTNASATNNVTFTSDTEDPNNVVLTYSANSSSNYTLQFDDAEYYVFKNINIKSTGGSYGNVVDFAGNSSNILLENNIIEASSSGFNSSGIYAYSGGLSDIRLSNNEISTNGYYALYLRGSNSSTRISNLILDSNDITGVNYGIYAYYLDAPYFRSNKITTSNSGSSYGIYMLYGGNNSLISKNDIQVSGSFSVYGMYYAYSSGSALFPIRVYNNFVSENSTATPSTARGVYLNNTTNVEFYNNSIKMNKQASNQSSALYINSGSNIDFINNNVVSAANDYAVYVSGGDPFANSDYNNLYSNGTLAYLGSNRTSINAWRVATSDDANSVSINPNFTSNIDLHVTNMSLNDLGTPLTVITDDIDGDMRHISTPDIGADEFGVDIDAGVIAITEPVNNACSGTQSVKVELKNFGQSTLTSATINWSVDNIAQTAFTWTGNLIKNATQIVTIGTYNFATANNYDIKAYTSNPNSLTDQQILNDTSSVQISINDDATVYAGIDATICQTSTYVTSATASNYSSLQWTTSGSGSFTSGNTLTATYTPSAADITAGSVYLKLTATSLFCNDAEDSLLLTITNSPVVSFTGLQSSYCPDDAPDTLIGSPIGGYFVGNGVIGNVFDPSSVTSGNITIKYVYLIGGCGDSTTQTTTVHPNVSPEITGLSAGYCVTSFNDTIFGTPVGGSFSGSITSASSMTIVQPSTLSIGNHTVTYTYTSPTSGCVFDTTYSFQIYNTPTVTISGLNSQYCTNEDADTLIGSPAGGVFGGPGISGNIFDPQTAGSGTHTIYYAYYDPSGCGDTTYQQVTINSPTSVTFSGLSSPYCEDDSPSNLVGIPSGGSFSGNGVVGSTFDPSIAGSGTHQITYTYIDGNNCAATDVQSAVVNSVPVVTASASPSTISSGLITNLSGSVSPSSSNYTYSWTPAFEVVNPNNLNTPTHGLNITTQFTLSVMDTITGCSSSGNTTVTVSGGNLSATATASPDTICQGDSVQLTALPSGGNGSYTVGWISSPVGFTSSSLNPKVAPSTSTTYNLVVDDGSSVVNTSVNVHVYSKTNISITSLQTDYCSNDAAFNLTAIPSGGNFYGSGVVGGQFDPSAANIGQNKIYYSYTNTNSCVSIDSVTVNVNDAPVANAGLDVSIPTGNDTILYGSATGGGNYKYLWSPASMLIDETIQNPSTVNLTSPQLYTLTVTDSITNCSSSDDVLVSVSSPNLSLNLSVDNNNICNGDQIQLTALAVGGSGSYTYNWYSIPSGFNSSIFNPIAQPTIDSWYVVEVNDGFNSIKDSVFITVNPAPTVSLTGLNSSYCEDDLPTILSGSPSGGVFSSASSGLIANIFDPNSAGTGQHIITYTYTSANGCISTDSDTTDVYPEVIADAGSDVSIAIGNDTILYGNATGGLGSFDYTWTPASELINANIQSPTTTILTNTTLYTLTVTDLTSGCFDDDQVEVEVTGGPLSSNATATPDTICDGDSVLLSALAGGGNGSGGYTYSWTSNPAGLTSTSASLYVFPSVTTTYTVQVNDGSTSTSSNVTVVVNPLPNISFSGLNSSYCDNEAIVTLTGSPSGGAFAGNGVNGNQFDPSGLTGSHIIVYTYTSTHGCTNVSMQSTSVNEAPIANAGTSGTIAGGSDTILYGSATKAGNYSFSWTPATLVTNPNQDTTSTVSLNATQLFTLYVTDTVTSCVDNDDVLVNVQGTPLTVSLSAAQSTICEGDSVQLNSVVIGGSGTYTYSWTSNPAGFTSSNASPYVKPAYSTIYTLSVDDGNTIVSKSITITVNPKPAVQIIGLESSYCETDMRDTLLGFPMGGYFLGSGMLSNVFDPAFAGAGQHIITYSYTNSNNCTATVSDTTVVYNSPVADAGSDVTISNGNDTILYGNASGGSGNYSFEWNPATSLINNLAQNPTTLPLTTSTVFTLKAVDNSSACFTTDDVIVTVKGGPMSANPFATPDTICQGSSVQLNSFVSGGSGNYSYTWSSSSTSFTSNNANPTDNPVTSTRYYLTIDDGSSFIIDSVDVFVAPIPNLSISGYNTSYCYNSSKDTIIGYPSGGVFVGSGISGNVFDPTVAGVGTHQITYIYTSQFGCQNSKTVSVNVNAIPMADAGSDILIPCGGPGALIGSSPQSNMVYSWSPAVGLSSPTSSSTIATPNIPTNYKLTVTDANTLCSNSDNVFVDIMGGPNAIASDDTLICAGETVTIYASGGTSYQWTNGVTTSSFPASPTTTTTYYVVVGDGNCFDTDSVTITVSNPQVFLGPDVVLLDTQNIILNAGFGYSDYLWSTGDTVQSIIIEPYVNAALGNNLYSVEVTDYYGCKATDDIKVGFVLNIDDLDNNVDVNIYPNPTEGKFSLEIEGTNYQEISIRITNVNGQLINESILEVSRGMNKFDFDLSTFPKGIYFIKLLNNEINKTEKLITQ